MASKYKSIIERCVSFSENLFDYHYFKSDLNLNFEPNSYKRTGIFQFQDKNKKLDIEPKLLFKI